MKSIEKEFVDFYIGVGRTWGLDTLSSKLIGILYLEPEEICIDELAKKTGYSLPSISNKMHFIETMGIVKRIKKPGSKKLFYFMEKDAIKVARMHFEKIYEAEIIPAKKLMPKLLDKYKKVNLNNEEKKKLEIIKNYNKQMLNIDKVYSKLNEYFDELE